MTCAILLITDVLFGTVATVITVALALAMFVVLWAVLPLKRRLKYRDEGLPLLRSAARRLSSASRSSRKGSSGASRAQHLRVGLPDLYLELQRHLELVADRRRLRWRARGAGSRMLDSLSAA